METKTKNNVSYFGFNERATKDGINMELLNNPEKFIQGKFNNPYSFGAMNILHDGIYRELAWQYNLRPLLRNFLYKQYGMWQEVYAPNKTSLRKVVGGKIDKITELK